MGEGFFKRPDVLHHIPNCNTIVSGQRQGSSSPEGLWDVSTQKLGDNETNTEIITGKELADIQMVFIYSEVRGTKSIIPMSSRTETF